MSADRDMFGMLGQLMQQAQAAQEGIQKAQERASARTFDGSSGGGRVTVRITGDLRVQKLSIDPAVFAGGDRALVEDLVVAALNDTIRRAQAAVNQEMGQVTEGLQLPNIPGLPGIFGR